MRRNGKDLMGKKKDITKSFQFQGLISMAFFGFLPLNFWLFFDCIGHFCWWFCCFQSTATKTTIFLNFPAEMVCQPQAATRKLICCNKSINSAIDSGQENFQTYPYNLCNFCNCMQCKISILTV